MRKSEGVMSTDVFGNTYEPPRTTTIAPDLRLLYNIEDDIRKLLERAPYGRFSDGDSEMRTRISDQEELYLLENDDINHLASRAGCTFEEFLIKLEHLHGIRDLTAEWGRVS